MTENFVFSFQRSQSNDQKMKTLLRILQNRKETIKTFITAIKIESRNEWVVTKLEKKIKICRKRLQQQENKSYSSYFSQLDDIAEITYGRGHMAVYGKSMRVTTGSSHQMLADDLGKLVSEIEDGRESLNGTEDKSFKDIVRDYKAKRDKELKDTKDACTSVVKTKNNMLDQKNKTIAELRAELDSRNRN